MYSSDIVRLRFNLIPSRCCCGYDGVAIRPYRADPASREHLLTTRKLSADVKIYFLLLPLRIFSSSVCVRISRYAHRNAINDIQSTQAEQLSNPDDTERPLRDEVAGTTVVAPRLQVWSRWLTP
ncbi:hypothetical protein IAQ61_009925 [Plenodomus lingam]|uniref:uncharacterized protein n=1 Tax=Leptosphaeria maculans TaxID=5022 RepID=UPI0033217822|nr:hypothetical protein IAQ61_009925 [Plenodomus lingam]